MDMAIMQKMAQIDTAFFDDPSNSDALNAAQTSETYITGNMPWAVDTIISVITFISGLLFREYDMYSFPEFQTLTCQLQDIFAIFLQ